MSPFSRRGRRVLFPPAHSLRSRVGDKPALHAVSFGPVLRDTNQSTKGNLKRNTQTKPEPKSPIYHAYTMRGPEGFWTRIGAFFPHDDGEGGTLLLDALPLDGRIVLRAPKDEE
ncbi:MAG: hypothetical protein E5Y30_00465 [Mesorhizobium sp.]|nr:hypothetical protein EN795_31090 [bacterium M00.F.Ca.ET.152.01.1.1]TIN73824.1 MAG: hypothetical protein E5Y30_00465 [Mesorhizobium sp.]